MAPAKKATTKPEVKAAEAAVKTTVPKTEEKAAVKPAAKAEEKKVTASATAPAKKETVKKETAKKTAGRKATAKKSAAKKTELKTSVCLQFAGKSYTEEDLVKMARDVWKYDLKQKLGDLVSIELYVKPEENTAYYIMNKDFSGNFYI